MGRHSHEGTVMRRGIVVKRYQLRMNRLLRNGRSGGRAECAAGTRLTCCLSSSRATGKDEIIAEPRPALPRFRCAVFRQGKKDQTSRYAKRLVRLSFGRVTGKGKGRLIPTHSSIETGGRERIRTSGRVTPTPDFESGAFNHSATLPPMDWKHSARIRGRGKWIRRLMEVQSGAPAPLAR